MYGPVPLLHLIRGEQVSDTGQLKQQLVLKAKEWRRSHDRRLGEDIPGNLFTLAFGCEEGCRRVRVGAVRGNVDEAVHIVLGHCLSNPSCAFNMDIFQ